MASACITLDNVSKLYGSKAAVSGLSLQVEQGEILGLLGPNGAGKSTTLAMIAGLARPSSGSITVFGRNVAEQHAAIAQRMGVLTERPSFYDHLSVTKNLALLARLSGREVTLDRTLDLAGLLPYADQRVGTLSRGLRQRVGLAQAFLTEPELLLLDEPTTALDGEQAAGVLEHLRLLSSKASVTIVLSSHRMDEVEAVCDRVAVLELGRLMTCENAESMLTYDKSQVDVLLDSPEAAGRKLAQEPWVRDVEVHRGRLRVRLDDVSPNHLATFLIGAGYPFYGIVPRRRSVQELYLKVKNQ
jgi:ABC-2 type transport system ATP-binding protein